MAELAAAKSALGVLPDEEAVLSVPASPPADSPWSVPVHLLRHAAGGIREAAQRACDSGAAAAAAQDGFAAVLQHGLHLQELASRLGAGDEADQLLLLHRACGVYQRANELRAGRAAVVLFNWAVALSDISRLAGAIDPGEAAEYLGAAALKYAAALGVDPRNAQALNNWGLILQDLAALSPPERRAALLPPSVARFRAAIALQPDAALTSRFAYNLGTVLYAHACWLQDAAAAAAGSAGSPAGDPAAARQTFADASMYILLAYALQPEVGVYAQSLSAVQRLLPLPYLRAGCMRVAARGTAGMPAESWLPAWFVLDGQVLQSVRPPAAEAPRVPGAVPNVAIELEDVADARLCWDPSLPAGGALWIGLKSRPAGEYLITEDEEAAAGWVDAIHLLLLLRKSDPRAEGLQAALIARRQRPAPA